MAVNEVYPEFLFSYGTLQLEAVQMATFGPAIGRYQRCFARATMITLC